MTDKISIIIPIYNVEEYLPHCIDSVLHQTYPHLEILLIDDGSPDRCGEICDEYARRDSRIVTIHQSNGGLSDARNTGIKSASGKYLTFLDSDDWLDPRYIETLYELILKSGSEIAICNFMRTSDEHATSDSAQGEIHEYTNIEALNQIYDQFSVQMRIACGKLYAKSLFTEIRFPVGRVHEDEFTTYRLIYKANKIILTSAELLYYRQRNDSIMSSRFSPKNTLDAIDAYRERAEFFKNAGLETLSARTYASVFFIFVQKVRLVDNVQQLQYREEFIARFKQLKNQLRNSRQKIGFRLFYELYYLFPRAVELPYGMYRKLKQNPS